MFLYLFLYCSNVVLVKISLESHSFRRLTEEMDRGRPAAYFYMMDVFVYDDASNRGKRDHWCKLFGSFFISLPSGRKTFACCNEPGSSSSVGQRECEREIRVDVAERRGGLPPITCAS